MSKSENQKVEVLEINNFAYQSYRKFVKGNFDLSKTEVATKLTRNVLLGKPTVVANTNHVWYSYGKLKILVKGGKKITCVLNHQEIPFGWEIDLALKEWLNKKLKIVA